MEAPAEPSRAPRSRAAEVTFRCYFGRYARCAVARATTCVVQFTIHYGDAERYSVFYDEGRSTVVLPAASNWSGASRQLCLRVPRAQW